MMAWNRPKHVAWLHSSFVCGSLWNTYLILFQCPYQKSIVYFFTLSQKECSAFEASAFVQRCTIWHVPLTAARSNVSPVLYGFIVLNRGNSSKVTRNTDLTLKRPASAYVKACKETPLEIYFIHIGNGEFYCILKTFCVICVLFSTKRIYFVILHFFRSNNSLFQQRSFRTTY